MSNSAVGFLERIENNTVVGWAYDPNNPDVHMKVQLRINDEIVQETLADIPRGDLVSTGIGTGSHGFSISMSQSVFELSKISDVAIWVSSEGTDVWQRLRSYKQERQEYSEVKKILNGMGRVRRSIFSWRQNLKNSNYLNKSENIAKSSFGVSGLGQSGSSSDKISEKKIHTSTHQGVSFNPVKFEVPGKLFGCVDIQETNRLSGWMLATRSITTPVVMVDDLPVKEADWPVVRSDVSKAYGIERRSGFEFRFASSPGAKVDLVAFDGERLLSAATLNLSVFNPPEGAVQLRRLIEDSAKPNSVAVTCWDGAHNPIGRAKVLYDILEGRRAVWLFTYLFDEFGGKLWEPLKGSNIQVVSIPWKQRHHYDQLFQLYGIRFSTVWMCKPRLPTLQLAASVAANDAKLILDFDDNEEHFSKSPGSAGKPYGIDTIGLVRNIIEDVRARTAASRSLANDYSAEIVRHARKPAQSSSKIMYNVKDRPLRVGFVGTVRPHKRILEAAQAIRVASHIAGREIEFCVYGDIQPKDYREKLEANRVKLQGTVLLDQLEGILQGFDLVLTGYPSVLPDDEPITRYQITSKIGDALVNGIPALVPRSKSVEDLEDVPGIFLFDVDDFTDVLVKAANYKKVIKIPAEFTVDGAYTAFEKVESMTPSDSSAIQSLRPSKLCVKGKRSVLLIWKQQDAGLYGRRVDQIARTIKMSDPDVTVRIIEFMNESVHAELKEKSNSFNSEAALILQLSRLKQKGVAECSEGVIYNQIPVKADADAAAELVDFLWSHGHAPSNTLMIVFPAFSLLSHLAKVLDPFPIISDVVDNQLSWGGNKTKPELIAQYIWLMRKSQHVIFNSLNNLEYFRAAGFLANRSNESVSTIPNWYIPLTGGSLVNLGRFDAEKKVVNIIYSGNLNDRIDWSLLERCAKVSSDIRLHIVGDAFRVTERLRSLTQIDNVVYHGPLNEGRLSSLLDKMHFAVMPHIQDQVSTYMNPLKVLMYERHGLRSVAINVPGLNDIDGLTVVDSADDFLSVVVNWMNEVRLGRFSRPTISVSMPEFAKQYFDVIRTQLECFED